MLLRMRGLRRGPVTLVDAERIRHSIELEMLLLLRVGRRRVLLLIGRRMRVSTRWKLLLLSALIEWRHLPHGVTGDTVEEIGTILALRPELAPA